MKSTIVSVMFYAALICCSAAHTSAQADDRLYTVTLRPDVAAERLDVLARDIAKSYAATIVEVDPVTNTLLVLLPASRVSVTETDPRILMVSRAGPSPHSERIPTSVAPDAETVPWTNGVAYQYDASGNVTKIGTDTFAYDVGSRVVQATVNGVTRTYEYDGFGNRTKCTQASTVNCQTYTITPSNNRIAGAGVYDDAGNVKTLNGHSYSYDALDMQSPTFPIAPFPRALRASSYTPLTISDWPFTT